MSGLRILFAGSRSWTDRTAIWRAFDRELKRAGRPAPHLVTVVHGGARGADTIAGQVAREYGCAVEVHLADWEIYGKAAGPVRNTRMVATGADVCLAFPKGESRGTRGCMELARQAGIPVIDYGVDVP